MTSTRAAHFAHSLSEDIKSIRKRVEYVVRGQVRMVDIDTQQGLRLVRDLEDLSAEMLTAIIPATE